MLLAEVFLVMLAAPPAGDCFPPEAGVDAFKVRWFCKQLGAAQETQLSADPAYRFTYIPSFHSTRVVVVRLDGGRPVAVGKVLSGKGGYDPGSLLRTTRRSLTDDEWRHLEQQLENVRIWESPDRDDRLGLDGAQWVLEGATTRAVQVRMRLDASET